MYEAQPQNTSIDISSLRIVPEQPGDDSRDDEGGNEDHGDVPLVLPPHDGALAQVADVCDTRLAAGLHEHPAHMRIPETLVGIIWVEVGVGITMVCPVSSRPPLD